MEKNKCYDVHTVKDLRDLIANLSDDTPIVYLTRGYFQVKTDAVSIWFGKFPQDNRREDKFPGENLMIWT